MVGIGALPSLTLRSGGPQPQPPARSSAPHERRRGRADVDVAVAAQRLDAVHVNELDPAGSAPVDDGLHDVAVGVASHEDDEGLALLHGFQGLFRAHRFGFGVQQPLRHAVRAPFFVFFTARRLHPNAPGTADAPGARTLSFYRLPKFVSRKRTVSYRDPLEPALPPAESSSPSAAGSSSAPLRAAGSPSSSPSISD